MDDLTSQTPSAFGIPTERPPIRVALLLVLGLATLLLHWLSNGWLAYGYMTDELYYLDCANRLAWGYVDHPPLSIALLWLARAILGDSLFAVRLLPALAGCVTVVLTGLMAREIGGGRAAQGVAATAAVAAPGYLALSGFYSMNAIDLLLWAVSGYLLLRLLNGADPRLWLLLGAVMGLGLLNKVSMLWLGLGLALGLVLTSERRWYLTRWPWLAGLIAFLVFAPHVVWQVRHDWPTLEFMRNAMGHKMPPKSVLAFIGEQLVIMHPFIAPLWAAGLVYYLFGRRARSHRVLGWLWVVVFLILLASGTARSYYLVPAYSMLLASGGLMVERFSQVRRWQWLPLVVGGVLAAGGAAAAPMTVDLLPPQRLIAYQRMIGLEPPRDDVSDSGVLPYHFALRFHAEAVTRAVAAAYALLSPEERSHVGILVTTFGEAGAINLLGRKLGLPRAISTHNNYWLWGPGEYSGDLMLVVADADSELLQLFRDVEPIGSIDCYYCMPELRAKSVYLCRGVHRTLPEVWPQVKAYW